MIKITIQAVGFSMDQFKTCLISFHKNNKTPWMERFESNKIWAELEEWRNNKNQEIPKLTEIRHWLEELPSFTAMQTNDISNQN